MPYADKEYGKARKRAHWAANRERLVQQRRDKDALIRATETAEERTARLEKERIRTRARRLADPSAHNARCAEYRRRNPEKRKESVNRSAKKCAARRKAYEREYHQKNKERIRAYNKARLHITREQRRIRRETDLNYRIKLNLSGRLHAAVKHCKTTKAEKTAAMVGCDIVLLRLHLESQFQPGMSWANYGKYGWHIDHKIPCAEFDLTDKEQQLKCFHYSNLRPLWAAENLRRNKPRQKKAIL